MLHHDNGLQPVMPTFTSSQNIANEVRLNESHESVMVTAQVTKTSSQVESWGGDLVDFQVVLVPSQVVTANPSDSQVYSMVLEIATADGCRLYQYVLPVYSLKVVKYSIKGTEIYVRPNLLM